MKDDRLRIPVEQSYLVSLGLATYAFSRLEWDGVWCGERLEPGFIRTVAKKTAGRIASDLLAIIDRIVDPAVRAVCEPPAIEFKALVDTRNGILHSNPATAPGGAQRLIRHGFVWTPEEIDKAADAFTECSTRMNALLYGDLRDGVSHTLNPA